MCVCVSVKRDIQDSDEEAVRVKEQSILELGGLLAKTGQAAGNQSLGSYSWTLSYSGTEEGNSFVWLFWPQFNQNIKCFVSVCLQKFDFSFSF